MFIGSSSGRCSPLCHSRRIQAVAALEAGKLLQELCRAGALAWFERQAAHHKIAGLLQAEKGTHVFKTN